MKRNQIRIIGGKWRSRLVRFSDNPELRPSPDRVRETLFNWLAPNIIDAVCLELYAGTGVLSFESLSRGAKKAVAAEINRNSIKDLQQNALLLNADSLQIVEQDVIAFLQTLPKEAFDIVFVDPPYKAEVLPLCFELLEKNAWLNPNALIYFEYNHPLDPTLLPNNWELLKIKKAGVVHYHLARFSKVKF